MNIRISNAIGRDHQREIDAVGHQKKEWIVLEFEEANKLRRGKGYK